MPYICTIKNEKCLFFYTLFEFLAQIKIQARQ